MLKLIVVFSCTVFVSVYLTVAKPSHPHFHDDDCQFKDHFPKFPKDLPSSTFFRPRKSISQFEHKFPLNSPDHLPDSSRWPFQHSEQYHKKHGFHHDYHNIHYSFPFDVDEDANDDMEKPFSSFGSQHKHYEHNIKPFPTFKAPEHTDRPVLPIGPTFETDLESDVNQNPKVNKPESSSRKPVTFIPVTEDVDDIINKIFTPRPRTVSSSFPNIDVRTKNNYQEK